MNGGEEPESAVERRTRGPRASGRGDEVALTASFSEFGKRWLDFAGVWQ